MSKTRCIDNKWIVVENLGNGGQGQVYKVNRIDEESTVYALKFLKKQKDTDRRYRMHAEVDNIRKLKNDHLVRIIDSNADSYANLCQDLYYVSEFIEGCTLEEYVEKKQVSFDEARQFFIAFLDTLSYCHSNGIIHRDIKPENIMLKSEILNNFVLIDFGLSFNLEEQEKITLTNQQLGNRFLLLPELVSGTPEQKQLIESDCAQACGVFFYLLTGVIPNSLLDGEGKAPHRREVSIKRLADKIDNEVVLRNINSLFDKAFANNLEERYHTANDIRKDLMTLFEYKVTALGDKNMGTGLIVSNNNDTFSYSVLMKTLNPETEIVSPSGLQLPMVTNVNELMNYCIALPHPVVEKVMKYYNQGDFATAASQIWLRTISLLRKRVLSLGEEFVADMVESDDIGYVRDLPAYKVIK